jgi:MFS family permease
MSVHLAATRLYLARAARYRRGFVAILLPVYLAALIVRCASGVATAALPGSALMTIGVGLVGARYGYRRLLVAASALMLLSGLALTAVSDYALILLAAFAGTINPSAGSVSVFVPLEHAALSQSIDDRSRTAAFARYSLIGALAAAAGSLAAASPTSWRASAQTSLLL